MKALQFSRKEARFVAASISSRFRPGSGAVVGPLDLVDIDEPALPGPDWVRVETHLAGICGSDLATIDGHSSRYFEPWISFPFTPGHEILGALEDGTRVVIEPVLSPEARGFEPPFEGAAPADSDDYRHLVAGPLEPGIQTGYCASTGGGWSQRFVAHQSQLHHLGDEVDDRAAVMIEPTAVGVHAALKADPKPGDTVAIIGSGTMGLTTLAALRALTPAATIIIGAKYPEQRQLAQSLGADQVVNPGELQRAVRRATASFMIGDDLSGGADIVIDAVGSSATIDLAIGTARPRGRVVILGMPSRVSIDLTAMWHRETELLGAYTYRTEHLASGQTTTSFALARDLVVSADLGRLVTAVYPLADYQRAVEHAANAGARGAVKICFDPRL